MINDVMLKRGKDTQAMVPYWDLSDAIVAGHEAMRNAGEAYLPKFRDETTPDYNNRKLFTKFTNVYTDALENLASKPFENEVEFIESDKKAVPEALREFSEDVDGAGNTLHTFAATLFYNGINSAIAWVFVDMPPARADITNRAEQKAAGIRPYWSLVLGRNVLAAKSKMIDSRETLVYMKIFEPGEPDQLRIFERDEATKAVKWTLYERRKEARKIEGEGDTYFWEIDAGTISIGVIPLVPFITGKRNGRSFEISPPLKAGADLQKELYQEESALKWNKHLGAYSMLAGNGVTPPKGADGKPEPVKLGPSAVLYAPVDKNGNSGTWAFIQPDPAVMQFLADDSKETKQQLREVMRQPLTAQSGNLTVITTSVAAAKTRSAVSAWGISLKNTLENAAVITCMFEQINTDEYDPSIYVYTDFDEFLDGKDLETLDADRDRGDISRETLWAEKKRRGVYSADFDAEEETERLRKELLQRTPSDNAPDTTLTDDEGKPLQ